MDDHNTRSKTLGGDEQQSNLGVPAAAGGNAPPQPPAPIYDTVESAAAKLGLGVDALRARARRAFAVAPAGATEVLLGGGITAFRFGRTWRFRFPR